MERLLQTTVAFLICLLLSLAWHATAHAQQPKPIDDFPMQCGPAAAVEEALRTRFKEEPAFQGKTTPSLMRFQYFTNPGQKTGTYVLYPVPGWACVQGQVNVVRVPRPGEM